jgi:hypothetical protein
MFPKYHTSEFEATLIHLRNLSALSIDNINEAVAQAMAKKQKWKQNCRTILSRPRKHQT